MLALDVKTYIKRVIMEYLNLMDMKNLITKMLICFCFCGGVFVALYGTSVLAEKILKFKDRAVKTAPHRK